MRHPFRVFANQNLGTQFDYTAFTGEWIDSQPIGQSPVLPEVNLTTGNVILKSTLVKTKETIGDWEFGFVYNAQGNPSFSYNIPVIIGNDIEKRVIFREKDGSQITYIWDAAANAYLAPAGGQSKKMIFPIENGGFLQLDPKTNTKTFFNAAGSMTCVYDKHGHAMEYFYDQNDQLQKVVSDAGSYVVSKSNNATTLNFTKRNQTESQLLATWQQLPNGLTATIHGESDYTVNYFLNDQNQLIVSQTDGTSLQLNFATNSQGNTQQLESIQQGEKGPLFLFDYSQNQTTITNSAGFVTTATLNKNGCIERFERELADTKANIKLLTTNVNYHPDGNIESIAKPNLAETKFKLNDAGLITEKKSPNGQVTQYDYDDHNFQKIIKRELISNTEKNPIWAVTRYVYSDAYFENGNAFRQLRFMVSPSGTVTELRYNGKHQIESERIYLGNKFPVSNLDPRESLHLRDLHHWVASQDPSKITLKQFKNNDRGQLTRAQQFSEIDLDGRGKNTLDASDERYENHTIWGAVQTRSEKVDVDSNTGKNKDAVTQNAFDQLQRPTATVNALGEKESIAYNDASQNKVITKPNGRSEMVTWNSLGKVESIATSVPGSNTVRIEKNHYDLAGNCFAITHVDGNVTYQLFDSLHRLRFSISPEGRVTEHCYDDLNRCHSETRYDQKIKTDSFCVAQPPTFEWLSENLKKDSKKNVSTYRSFDLSGRLQFEVDGRGAIVEHRYDFRNREILKIAYKDEISKNELDALKSGSFIRSLSKKDSVSATFYDVDSHIIATQDPGGYVTTYDRNPAGFLNKKYCYAKKIGIISSNELVLPQKSKEDYSQYFYTDAKRQTRLIVDGVKGANYAVQKAFYPTGKMHAKIKFANQAKNVPELGADPASLTPDANSEDRKTVNEYDLLKRLTKEHLPEQCLRLHEFDNMNNEVLTSVGDDAAQLPAGTNITTEVTAKRFDDWGQLVAEVKPLLYGEIQAIQNNTDLSSAQKAELIAKIWENRSLRHIYDEATGLYIAKIDIVAQDGDILNQPITYFYSDKDRRIVLTIGPEGQASKTQWSAIFDKPLETRRLDAAVESAGLAGGFLNDEISALLKPSENDIIESHEYDGEAGETKHVDPDGFVTKTEFNMFGHWKKQERCVDSTTPTLTVEREFDQRQLLLTETQTSDHDSITTVNNTYDNLHGLCTAKTDESGETTRFSYEPRGVLQVVSDPLCHSTELQHDAFEREIQRVSPMGQITTQEYTQSSRKVTTSQWDSKKQTVLSQVSDVKDAFGNTTVHQDAMGNVTQTTYDLENNWHTKFDALDNQYRQIHDARGLLVENHYRHRNTTLFNTTNKFSYSRSRQLTEEIKDATESGLNLKTKYRWNALSQRYHTTTALNHVRKTKFNKRSLATEHHKILNDQTSVVTAQSYNATRQANSLTTSTTSQAHSYQEKVVSDGFGREKKRIVDPNNLQLTTEKRLDKTGRVIAITDPKGQVSYFIRDAIGNVRFEINPKGGVIEHRYNAAYKPYFTIQYKTPVDLTKVRAGMKEAVFGKLLSENNYDRHTHYFYDELNNERFRVNRAGAVTEKRYNANNQEIASIQYYTTVIIENDESTSDLAMKCESIRNKEKDKATYRVLDKLGQEVFTIQADGAVTQKFYYSTLHQANVEIKYATKIANPEEIAQLPIEEIESLLTVSQDDRHTHWIVDHLNRLQFHVAPNGAVTRFDYDGDTKNKKQITEFANAVEIPSHSYEQLRETLLGLVPNPLVDNIQKSEFDSAEREIKRTNALGKSEYFGYDGASRRSSHTTLSGHMWRYEFDGANRLWREFSPETTTYAASIDSSNVSVISISSNRGSVEKETAYDENSNIIQLRSGVGLSDERVVNFDYDELNLKTHDIWSNVPIDDPAQATSLTVRPESVQSVSKKTIYDAHGQKIIEFDQADNPTFYVYDAQNYLRYKVNAKGYVIEYRNNSFGQCEHSVSYATKLKITLSDYYKTGLFSDIIESKLVKNPNADRSVHQVIDQNNRVTKITRDAVVCYIPNSNTNNPGTVVIQEPTKEYRYNAFGETTALSILIDQTNNVKRNTLRWYDKSGNEIARVDENGIATLSTFNLQNKKIKEYCYAAKIPSAQLATLAENQPISDLESILKTIENPLKDHIILTPRDILGNQLGVIHVGLLSQQIVSGQQRFEDNPAGPVNAGVTYTYTSDNKVKTITYPDGQVESFYYDERRYLIAKAFVPRTQTLADGTKTIIQPIIYYHISDHGNRVETYQPEGGCVVVTDPTSDLVPMPISNTEKDLYDRFLFDPRSLLLAKQDAENNLKQFTNTVTGKVARQYYPVTSATNTPGTFVTDTDEKRTSYDELDNKTLESTYRNSAANPASPPKAQVAYEYDAFDMIAEGPGDKTWPLQHQFDQAGRKWASFTTSNAAAQPIGSIGELTAYNGAGEKTLEVKSHTKDLSKVIYQGSTGETDYATVLGYEDDVANYFLTKTLRDAGGRPNALVEPGYQNGSSKTVYAPKSILLSSDYPQFGNASISMRAHIDPKKHAPKVRLTVINGRFNASIFLPMVYCDKTKRFGVDISQLMHARYQVEIEHGDAKDDLFRWKTEINWNGLPELKSEKTQENKKVLTIGYPKKLPLVPRLHIWIEHYGQKGFWKPTPILFVDRENNTIQFDASELPHDQYRYHLGGSEFMKNVNTFEVVSENEKSYLAYTDTSDPTIIRPTHGFAFDNFGKKSQMVTPSGAVTTFDRNKQNKLVTQTDPAIAVQDTSGNVTTVNPVTKHGYNLSGKKIGVCDANSNTELFIRDEANQILSHTAGDSTPYYTKARNAFGQDIETTSASGNTWKKRFSRRGKVNQVTMPSGDVWNYSLNERDFLFQIIPPANSVMGITRYAQGVFGDMSAHYFPMGQSHLYDHDRRHGILSHQAFDVGATTATYSVDYSRDYLGNLINKTDGTGSIYQYSYYPSGSLYQEVSILFQNHGDMMTFDSATGTYSQTPIATPGQNKTYTWLTHLRLQTIADSNSASSQTLTQVFNINRDVISLTETNGAGNILRQTIMTYNDLRWMTTLTDTHFSLTNSFDAVSNRRNMNATYNPGSNGTEIEHDAWYTQDNANRVLVNGGQMVNGVIQSVASGNFGYSAPSQGNTFSYGNGLRNTQSLYILSSMGSLADTNPVSASFGYDVNDRLAAINTAQVGDTPQPISSPVQQALSSYPVSLSPTGRMNFADGPFPECALIYVIYFPKGIHHSSHVGNLTSFAIQNNAFINPTSPPHSWQVQYFFPNHLLPYISISTFTFTDGVIYQGSVSYKRYESISGQANSFLYPENIQYTSDGLFAYSAINFSSGVDYRLRQINYNLNGLPSNYYYFNFDNAIIYETPINNYPYPSAGSVSYPSYNVDGLPIGSSSLWSSVTDTLTNAFSYFDTSVITLVTGTRTDPYGSSGPVNCPRYYDSNNALNAVTGVSNPFNPKDTNQYSLYFNNSLLNGRLLSEDRVLFSGATVSSVTPTEYYQDGRGHVVASYGEISNSQNDTEMNLSLIADPVIPISASDIQAPSTIIQAGDNWDSISYRLFRDAAYASILRAYNSAPIAVGQRIDTQQVIDAYNKALDYSPYERLIQIVYNAMYPALKTPEPPPPPPPHHESFWDEIISIVVAVVIMCIAPHIGAFLFSTLVSELTPIEIGVASAIAGAIADAATQGIAIAFDDEHGFSLKEMFENVVTSGVTAGFSSKLGISKLLGHERGFDTVAKAFSEEAGVGLTVQLVEMAAGMRKTLDLKLVIEQASATVLSAKVDDELPKDTSSTIINAANEIDSAATGLAFGYQENPIAMAANVMGDVAGDKADVLATKYEDNHSEKSDSDLGNVSKPSRYSDSVKSVQTASAYVSQESGANDSLYDLYHSQNESIGNDVNEMYDASSATAQATSQAEATHYRAQRMQERATQQAANSTWENRVATDLYDNQQHWWARGIIAMTAAFSSSEMSATVHAANVFTRDLTGDVAGSYGTDYFDALQNGTSTWSDAFDFVGADVGMQAVGEIGAGILDAGARYATDVLPSVGRNVAGVFGRGAVSNSAADEFDVADGTSDSNLPTDATNKSRAGLGPIDATSANAVYTTRGYFAPYDKNFRPRNIELINSRTFVRVHGEDNQISKWMMRSRDIEGLTPQEIKEKFALEFLPKYASEVDVFSGARMRVSIVGAQPQWGVNGGGIQYESLQRIPESAFKSRVPIYQPLVEPNYFLEPYDSWSSIVVRR